MNLKLSQNAENLFSNNLKDCKCRHCFENIKFAIVSVCIPKYLHRDLYCKEHFGLIDYSFDYKGEKYLIKIDLPNINIDYIINEYFRFKKISLLE